MGGTAMKRKMVFSGLIVAVLGIVAYGVFARTTTPKYEFRYDKITVGDINAFVTASFIPEDPSKFLDKMFGIEIYTFMVKNLNYF